MTCHLRLFTYLLVNLPVVGIKASDVASKAAPNTTALIIFDNIYSILYNEMEALT